MVARIPGFNIDDGESVRGFGGAAGKCQRRSVRAIMCRGLCRCPC
jgi:hypothetical protein